MGRSDSVLPERIETLVSDRPESIRSQVVEAMRAAVPSHFGMFFKCATAPSGELYFTGLVTDGDQEVVDRVSRFTDAPVLQCPWLPPHGDPQQLNRFVRIRSFYKAEYQSAFEAEQVIWRPLETGDQLRVVICDGRRLLGWIGLIRRGLSSRFSAEEERQLQGALGSIRSALSAAEALESRSLQDDLVGVLRPDGSLEHASQPLSRWLNPDRAAYLRRKVRAVDDGTRPAGIELLDGAETRLVRLDGPTGVRYLVTLKTPEPMRYRPRSWLSGRQLEVAEYAAAGATVGEIATTLKISGNTVKAHLKSVYQRLGVASRVELAEHLQDA